MNEEIISENEEDGRKVLLVAYTFPPIPYGGTYRCLRLCKGLAEHNTVECHVLTLKIYEDIPNDYELLSKVPESVIIHRTPIVDPWRAYQGVKEKFTGKKWFDFVNKIISIGLYFITFPDHMIFWIPFAVFKARKVIRKHRIKTVLVSSPPDSSQLVGWILKRFLHVRWIADFRDPIYGNVAQVNMIDPSSFLERFRKKMLAGYDRFIASHADALVANTETHAEQLKESYGCNNVHVIRNSFDSADFIDLGEKKFPEFTIAHIGSIYGKRNPEILFAAINQLAGDYAPQKLNLRVVFLGLGGQSLQASIEKYNVQDYVAILDQVPHKEAIACMCRSHFLLLIKATGKWSKGQIPGKFYEYIGSRNPVLCIGPKDSEVAELIQEHDLGNVVEDDVSEMVSVVRKGYEQYLQSGASSRLIEEKAKLFSSAVMVRKMCKVLEEK